ncbi:glycosyltransferase [Rhodopirellula sp. P2]|uniref:glycosyltransferase n=1 Tax=Rhodopirellula sp. P2 TaxID=2127060 RepID=UPI00236812D4|nr:glycosyltransferase [Rhodopirellula sp. P2]WDQ15818.1 glycosyltransferase [Rhodopirellula sp. P2]
MPRRRVLLMASSMRGGGSELQTAMLARHLDRERFEVHLYLTQAVGDLLTTIPGDVVVHHPPESFPPQLWDRIPGGLLRRQAEWFRELVGRAQVDVIYDRTFHMTLIAGHPTVERGSSANRRPRVSTIVSPPEVALPLVEKRFVWLKRRRLARAYRRSAAVIAVSEAARQSAIQYYGLPETLVETIRNPVDADAIRAAAGAETIEANPNTPGEAEGLSRASSMAGDPRDALRLVVVGRMTEEKGHATLLDAIGWLMKEWPASLPPLEFRFIGEGPRRADLESRWKDMVLAAGPKDTLHRVEFVGAVQPASAEIAGADGLVLPSHFEGLPNVVLEAFVLQTPVVATRAGGTVELQISEDAPTCHWAEPNNPASLAQAIREFAGQADQRHRHVANASQLVRENHGLSAAVDRISELLLRAGT